jgi:hypothetical protein
VDQEDDNHKAGGGIRPPEVREVVNPPYAQMMRK